MRKEECYFNPYYYSTFCKMYPTYASWFFIFSPNFRTRYART